MNDWVQQEAASVVGTLREALGARTGSPAHIATKRNARVGSFQSPKLGCAIQATFMPLGWDQPGRDYSARHTLGPSCARQRESAWGVNLALQGPCIALHSSRH